MKHNPASKNLKDMGRRWYGVPRALHFTFHWSIIIGFSCMKILSFGPTATETHEDIKNSSLVNILVVQACAPHTAAVEQFSARARIGNS